MKKVSFEKILGIAGITLVILSAVFGWVLEILFGISTEALFAGTFGFVILGFFSWNFASAKNDWFSITMMLGFGGGIVYGFYVYLYGNEMRTFFQNLMLLQVLLMYGGYLYRDTTPGKQEKCEEK